MVLNSKTFVWFKKNLLFILLLLGVILGVFAGFTVNDMVQNSTNPTPKELSMFISFPGEIFLRMLQLLVLPFVVSSVIISLATLDKKSAAKLGKAAFVYFFLTSLIAVVLAVVIATLFMKPNVQVTHKLENPEGSSAVHAILDMFRYLYNFFLVIWIK
jgi:Na+/H+-dicarboxylate symporter